MPDVVDLLLDMGQVLVEVRERVKVFREGVFDVGHCGIKGDVRTPLALL